MPASTFQNETIAQAITRLTPTRPWLAHYPPGVPPEISVEGHTSLGDLAEASIEKFAQRTAYTCMDVDLTFAEVGVLSVALAAWLQSRGIEKGGRVALMMPNVLQYPVAIVAVMRAGYVVANVNPLYTPRELEHQLTDCGAEAIIVLENFCATLESVLPKTKIKHVVVASMGDLLGFFKGWLVNYTVRNKKKLVPAYNIPNAIKFNDAVRAGKSMTFKKPQVGLDDIAFLQYTGGTTGVAKGAVLLHRNIIGSVLSAEAWLQPALTDTSKGPPPDPVIEVCALPMYHIFALVSCMWLAMKVGGQNLLIVNPRDVDGMVETLRKHKFNVLPAVNTMFNTLVNHPGFQTLDFSSLRISNGGGMAVQKSVAEQWLKLTNTPIIEGFGLTETCSGATCNPAMSTAYTGDVGMPMPSAEVSIRDDDGNVVADGEPGEICLRGIHVMAGYWQRQSETDNVMTADGFFKSGDIGVITPTGHIKIVDRKKDMILVSGFNVYPNEIEDVVASHPGVMECAAVGILDDKSGEAVKLYVVKKDPNLTKEQVAEFCRAQLTGYKNPRSIEFKDALPKTNVGKILRRALRDEARAATK
jgi:long-chain acyl-CoA synthetase